MNFFWRAIRSFQNDKWFGSLANSQVNCIPFLGIPWWIIISLRMRKLFRDPPTKKKIEHDKVASYIVERFERRYMIHECISYWNQGSSIAVFLFVYGRIAGWKVLLFSSSLVENNDFAFQLVKSNDFEGTTERMLFHFHGGKCFIALLNELPLHLRNNYEFSRWHRHHQPAQRSLPVALQHFDGHVMRCYATQSPRDERKEGPDKNAVGSEHPQLITPQVVRNLDGIVEQNPRLIRKGLRVTAPCR